MDWMTIASLIVFGLVLIVIEILFVPGTTVVGIVGFGLLVTGIAFSFAHYGKTVGWAVTAGSSVFSGVLFFWALRTGIWKRFSLKDTISGKVNEGEWNEVKVGLEGVAISSLRPSGKVEIGGKQMEASTLGTFLESGAKVRVVQVLPGKIVVEPF